MKVFSIISVLSLLLVSISCSDNFNETMEPAVFNLRLTDAPAEYLAVNIDIEEVELHYETSDDEGQWITLTNVNSGVYDLLDYSNGLDTLLTSETVPSGEISQIRLILGSNNNIVTKDINETLKVPSGETSGLKLDIHEYLEGGVTYNFWIDFDASKSIVELGNGGFQLKPVLRLYSNASSGSIKGMVQPKESMPHVFIEVLNDTFSTYADTSGYFIISGVPAGIYTLNFDPVAPYQKKSIENVSVENGYSTDLGTIEIIE